MEIFSNLINTIITVFVGGISIYGFFFVRASKFVAVIENENDIVNVDSNSEIKFNNTSIKNRLRYYKIIVSYTGVADFKKEDVEKPFTISNVSENSTYHNPKILQTSEGFEPKLQWHKNELTIDSSLFKMGDTVELQFYLESDKHNLRFKNRIFNVNTQPEIYNDSLSTYKATSIIGIFVFFSLIYTFLSLSDHLIGKFDYRDEFLTEYNYRGYKASEAEDFLIYLKVDSIYADLELAKNPPVDIQIIASNRPSKLADSIYYARKRDQTLKFGEKIDVNSDLSIAFIDNRKRSIHDYISDSLMILFFATILIGVAWMSFKSLISFILVRKVHKFLK
ncbi:hypothetical protein [Sphingobacterium chungjuense]|uniref:hypothetical protein n=1 Tax=Sphingobacterium chungjuense TaxID=2675553 RepID=UPI001409391B|nr:hypothetical protein [Sphingobacterium chungjuense]